MLNLAIGARRPIVNGGLKRRSRLHRALLCRCTPPSRPLPHRSIDAAELHITARRIQLVYIQRSSKTAETSLCHTRSAGKNFDFCCECFSTLILRKRLLDQHVDLLALSATGATSVAVVGRAFCARDGCAFWVVREQCLAPSRCDAQQCARSDSFCRVPDAREHAGAAYPRPG